LLTIDVFRSSIFFELSTHTIFADRAFFV
jgi:hypothetical protein